MHNPNPKPTTLTLILTTMITTFPTPPLIANHPSYTCHNDTLWLTLPAHHLLITQSHDTLTPTTTDSTHHLHHYALTHWTTLVHTSPTENPHLLIATPRQCQVRQYPLWLATLPPIIAILLVIFVREVLLALMTGILFGVLLLHWDQWSNPLGALLYTLDGYLVPALANPDHATILIFSLGIGGIVAMLSRTGLLNSLIELLTHRIIHPVKAQLAIWFAGLVIFFDDYANTLVIGNTMRALSDRARLSREKFAYLVDSTAAPVASIALVTTWVGTELSYIHEALRQMNFPISAYQIFLHSLSFAFYPILTLIFMLLIIITQREFGPMLRAERRARGGRPIPEQTPQHHPTQTQTTTHHTSSTRTQILKATSALLPILTLITTTFYVLWNTGLHNSGIHTIHNWQDLIQILGNGNSLQALLWGTGMAFLVTLLITVPTRLTTLASAMNHFLSGVESLLPAALILLLAWTLAQVSAHLQTSFFFLHLLQDIHYSLYLLPALVFILSGITAFATGTSWGTMAILYPVVLPSTGILLAHQGVPHEVITEYLAVVAASVLGGAVFGDHCSPISDTTVLSALATGCPLVDHVRTQLPYALTTGLVTIALLLLWGWLHLPTPLLFLIGFLTLIVVIRVLGIPIIPQTHQQQQQQTTSREQ